MPLGMEPGGRARPRRHCVRWGPIPPLQKGGGAAAPNFSADVLWPNGWMDQYASWYEVGLGPGHIALDGDPSPT